MLNGLMNVLLIARRMDDAIKVHACGMWFSLLCHMLDMFADDKNRIPVVDGLDGAESANLTYMLDVTTQIILLIYAVVSRPFWFGCYRRRGHGLG